MPQRVSRTGRRVSISSSRRRLNLTIARHPERFREDTSRFLRTSGVCYCDLRNPRSSVELFERKFVAFWWRGNGEMESFFVKEYGGKMYSDLLTMINSLKRKNYAPAGAFCSLNNGTAFDLSKVISEATITLLIRDHVAERGRFGFVSGFEDYTTLGQYSSLFREERERFQLEQIEENRIVESSPSSIDLQELLRGTHNSSPPNNLEVIEESNESKPPIIIPKGIRKIRI